MMLNNYGLRIIESAFVPAGRAISSGGTIFMHPLDVVGLQHPELDAVGRVMILVDRVVARALARIETS